MREYREVTDDELYHSLDTRYGTYKSAYAVLEQNKDKIIQALEKADKYSRDPERLAMDIAVVRVEMNFTTGNVFVVEISGAMWDSADDFIRRKSHGTVLAEFRVRDAATRPPYDAEHAYAGLLWELHQKVLDEQDMQRQAVEDMKGFAEDFWAEYFRRSVSIPAGLTGKKD